MSLMNHGAASCVYSEGCNGVTYLTAQEAAKRLKISARKIYSLAAAGELAAYRFGSAVRFAPSDLDAYTSKCRSPATTQAAGTTSLTVSSMGGEHALTAYFQRARQRRKRSTSSSEKRAGSSNLRLVATSQNH